MINLPQIVAEISYLYHSYVLTPGRYVGAEEVEDDDEAFEEKMLHLTKKLEQQFEESARLEAAIRENLQGLGYDL
ncbi:SAM-dependent DNA methyltransferase [Brunnivagina elsteri]|uniref:SAM-dependent DNA methyltransferase n=1 Tax=Brunnivagina elsteri TaxID=1247191 RepID=UPI001B8032D6|nr:SAM-dependent DNA methyltransferase [Calothrix elsteri]